MSFNPLFAFWRREDISFLIKEIEMTFDEALSYLEDCRSLGSRPGLETIKTLLKRMGN